MYDMFQNYKYMIVLKTNQGINYLLAQKTSFISLTNSYPNLNNFRPYNLHVFCMFFTHFFLNRTSRTHHARKFDGQFHAFPEKYIKYSNHYIVFSKPCCSCHLSSNKFVSFLIDELNNKLLAVNVYLYLFA